MPNFSTVFLNEVEPIDYLDVYDLIEIGKSLILIFGRDEGLLESAAMRPQTIIYGEDAYPTFEDKVASSSSLPVITH